MAELVKALYWRLCWFVWDAREWLFVREAMRLLRHDEIVYVHPRNGGEAKAALLRMEHVVVDPEPHSHVEGR